MLVSSGVSALTCLLIRNSSKLQLRSATSCVRSHLRCFSNDPMPLPDTDDAQKEYSPKIHNIVKEISQLTLLEVADLNTLLKKTLNISEAVMSLGAMPAATNDADDEEEAPLAKNSYALKIIKFDASKKVALIKYIKTIMDDMNLVQAKRFVEAIPAVVRSNAPKDEAEKLAEEMKEFGVETTID